MPKFNVGDTVCVISSHEITWDPYDQPLGWDDGMYDRCGKIFKIIKVNKLNGEYDGVKYSYELNDQEPCRDGWHFKWLDIYLRPTVAYHINDNVLFDFL